MRLGIDIGGTFTDFVLLDDARRPSTDMKTDKRIKRMNVSEIGIRFHPLIRFAEGNPFMIVTQHAPRNTQHGESHAFRN